jgi:hypothetical protein
MTRASKAHPSGFLHDHSLSLIVSSILALLFVSYAKADPSTHIGAFFGNAIADWLGMLVFVVATKYFFEVGSKESRRPPREFHARLGQLLVKHSLTLVLVVTGVGWIVVFAHSAVNGKWGQVVGNIVSEWTQILGLVIITKYGREAKSTEA